MLTLVLVLAQSAQPQAPTTPVLVTTSGVDGATLGIPRWKGYMSPTNPDKFWLSFANSGGSSNDLCFTTNAGATWSGNTITIEGYMDFHLSLFGRNNDLFFTFPGVKFRRFIAPAESISDAGPLVTLNGTSAQHRSNIMVQDNGRIWVFTRQGSAASENVRYQYSDNGGSSWTTGTAYATGAANVRIGSMPYVDGNPALVVLHLEDARGYEYYLWNGSSFQAMPDHSIWAAYVGYDRSFTHNQINDTIMHLVFGDGANLRHVWKNYANGTGSWNTSIITTESNNSSIDWYPISTVRGNELYVFYCRKSSGDEASMRVYYRKWSQVSQTWGAEFQVSTQNRSRDPNTCFHVPAAADYIPVFWSAGTGPYNIYFSKVPVEPLETDTIPPSGVIDLGASPGPNGGQVTLYWTATGDDHNVGTPAGYDIRYFPVPINESNWAAASTANNTPGPLPAGEPQECTVSQLPGGSLLYFALKAVDDAGNESGLSNLALVLVTDVAESEEDPLLPTRTGLVSLWPNPFNSEVRIEYEVGTPTLVELGVYNVLGRRVAVLVNQPVSRGRYSVAWDGTDNRGSPVASGVYFCRLLTENSSDVTKLVYLK
jgi:hypothetical protein